MFHVKKERGENMKKIKAISSLMIVSLIAGSLITSYGDTRSDVGLKLNGAELRTSVSPTVIDGRTLVPIRVISESIGATVNWNESTKEVEIIYTNSDESKTYIILPIGKRQVKINKSNSQYTKDLDVPAQILDGRTMVPVRFVAEELGLEVNWNSEVQTVELYNKQESVKKQKIESVEKQESTYGKLYSSPNILKYEGQLKNGVPNGKGVYYFLNGDIFTGEISDNKKEGYGELRYKTNDTYRGTFKNDKKNGQGKYVWSNGESYEGEWKDDLMQGQGTYVFKNGDMYVGQWSNNCMEGQGIYIGKDGNVLTGIWKNNKYQY